MQNLSAFISEYEAKLNRLTDNITAGNLKTIEGSLERLEQVRKQLDVTGYRLVFIGKPGSGKTTTICNYLNLVRDMKVGEQFERPELFDTGSGRTTAAEVHFMKADQTAIVVHPMEIEQQRGMIKDYCAYIWGEAFPVETDSGEPAESSHEYERIIRNMLGFDSIDDFVDHVSHTYDEKAFEQFITDTLDQVSISSRTQNEFTYSDEGDVKDWLQKTFNAINHGKIKNVCIPDRIDVRLNPDDLDFCIPEIFSEVIDTRGYDGNAREDLREYIEADDTVCIILDEVKSLPGDIQRRILTDWVDKGQNDIIDRISLFINVRGDELAYVNDADGDPEKGERLKRSELKRKISSEKLNYRLENTLFADPYCGVEIRSTTVNNRKRKFLERFDTAEREQLRDKITEHLTSLIQHHRDSLSQEAEELQKNIEQTYLVISTPSKSRRFSDKLAEISAKIAAFDEVMQGDIKKTFGDCESAFLSNFRRHVRWNSARKTAYMEGYWRNANIYYEYMEYCEKKIKGVCSPRKAAITENISHLRECDASSEEIEAFIHSCQTTVFVRYEHMVKSAKESVKQLCKDSLTRDCWSKAQNVSAGIGYYDRLLNVLYKQMVRSELSEKTIEIINEEISSFTNEVLRALNSKQEL